MMFPKKKRKKKKVHKSVPTPKEGEPLSRHTISIPMREEKKKKSKEQHIRKGKKKRGREIFFSISKVF